jgi:hypothetical protein
MPTDHPTINLSGYQRQRELERRLSYSPVGFALAAVGCVGLGVLAVGQYATFQNSDFSFGILLVGFGITLGAFGGMAGYLTWRLSRLKCPCCGGATPRFVTDLSEDSRGRWIARYEIDGRYCCPPFGDDNDTRPFVRLMNVVRACQACRTYFNFGEIHQQTCLEDDWERIHRRFPNHERDMQRREAWGNALGYVWIGALLLFFVFMIVCASGN